MVKLKRLLETIEGMPDNETLKKLYGPDGYPLQWQLAWKRDNIDSIRDKDDSAPKEDPEAELKKKRQEYLTQQGKERKRLDQHHGDRDRKFQEIEDIKVYLASQVSDIIGNTLSPSEEDYAEKIKKAGLPNGEKNDFLNELNALIGKYSFFKNKVDSNAKRIDIDAPFKDKDGNIMKFGDRIGDTESVVPSGIISDIVGGGVSLLSQSPFN